MVGFTVEACRHYGIHGNNLKQVSLKQMRVQNLGTKSCSSRRRIHKGNKGKRAIIDTFNTETVIILLTKE